MKRILSLIIISVMIMSLFAFAPAFAAEPLEVDANGYSLIKTQTDADNYLNGKTIKSQAKYKLATDINITSPIYVYANYSLELDGNNHKITLNNITAPTGGLGVGLIDYAGKSSTINIKNLTLTGSVSGAYSAAAVVGYAHEGSTVTLENIVIDKYTTITSTATKNNAAGGAVGYARGATVTLTNVDNYAAVTSGLQAAGLVGYTASKASTITMTQCANYGTITSTGGQVAGLIVTNNLATFADNITIKECFNAADKMSGSSGTAALAYIRSSSTTGLLENSFNVANNNNYYFAYTKKDNFKVENCYNTGDIKQLFYGTDGDLDASTCYFLEGTVATGARYDAIEITKEDLQNISKLEELGFDSKIWEYNENPTPDDAYIFPQLKDNHYTLTIDSIPNGTNESTAVYGNAYNEALVGNFANGTFAEVADEETGTKAYNGKFLATYSTVASDYDGYEKTYGVKIVHNETGEEYTQNAKAGTANNEGKYGIIFYGTGIQTGTYTVTPYTAYEGLRQTQTFYGQSKTVTVE